MIRGCWLGLVALLSLTACSVSRGLDKQIDSQPLYQADFSGFYVAEAASGKELYARDADRLYTPASNVKLLTLATCLAWLPQDSLPALAYRADGDTLRLWAVAYPLLAGDEAPYNDRIRRAIAEWPGPVEFNMHGYRSLPRFGEGWMWDDYQYPFARERSGLPVYRNLLRVIGSEELGQSELPARPSFLVVRRSDHQNRRPITRNETGNRFYVRSDLAVGDTVYAPLFGVRSLATQLLEDWTGRSVRYHNMPLPSDWGAQTFKGLPRDSLLRQMMLPSDNFLAEHLLLQAGLYHSSTTDEQAVRQEARRVVLKLTEQELRWADGSGISHYNLASPRALGKLLLELYASYPKSTWQSLLPAGGESGTLRDFYKPNGAPYVYAKTGTLRHNHNLSGFLLADSGKWLVFSIMNNHYAESSRDYKAAMEATLLELKRRF